MLYLTKKGQYKVIRNLIIALLSFLVVLLLVRDVSKEITTGTQDIKCKLSIEAAARSKSLPSVSGVGRPHVKLDCPRDELLIKKSDIVDGNKVNQDKAHAIIAEAMWGCWKKVGQGKIDPFSNFDNKQTSYCMICDSILFDEELKDFVKEARNDEQKILDERSIKDVVPFLISHKPKDADERYFELFYKTTRVDVEAGKDSSNARIWPGSVILVQMHKLKAKESVSGWSYIGAGLTLAAGVIGAIITGGASIPAAVAAGGMILGTGAIAAYDLYSVYETAFADCKDCNAIGGMTMLSSEKSFSTEMQALGPEGEVKYSANLCDVLVN